MSYFVGLAGSDVSRKMPIDKMKEHIVPLNKFSAKWQLFSHSVSRPTPLKFSDSYQTTRSLPEDDKVLFQLAFDQIYREYVSASPSLCLLKETLRPIIWIKWQRELRRSKIMSTGFLDIYTDHSDMMAFRVSGKSQLYEMKKKLMSSE